jgi:hypothetical protein
MPVSGSTTDAAMGQLQTNSWLLCQYVGRAERVCYGNVMDLLWGCFERRGCQLPPSLSPGRTTRFAHFLDC